jgi:hypothetical protein
MSALSAAFWENQEKEGNALALMAPAPLKHQIQGAVFAAQACSCMRDPAGACTGDPCTCGDTCPCEGADLYLGPRWRFVGDHIDLGTIEGVDVSARTFLNLAQTSNEASRDWHEVILIDDGAPADQVRVLLDLFQEHQGSAVAHPQDHPSQARPAYLVPMRYQVIRGQSILAVTFSPDRSRLVQGQAPASIQVWTFNGRVAVRGQLD